MIDLAELHSKSFSDHLNSSFKVNAGNSGAVTLRLTEVNEPPSPPHIEAFSLIFKGPLRPRLPQQIFVVEHERIGTFHLFLTAIAADDESTSYEAVFHRVQKKKP